MRLEEDPRADAERTHVRLSVMQPTFAPELLDRVRARGFAAELSAAEGGATVEVEAPRGDRELWLAVEDWLAAESVPLVPVSVGQRSYVLRPPLG